MSWLWPMITPGTPEKVKPETSIGAAGRHGAAVQAHLVPDAGEAGAEVRVVRQQRGSRLGVLAVDHPAVAADPGAVPEQLRQGVEAGPELTERRDLVRGVRRPRAVAVAGTVRVLRVPAVDQRALAHDRRVLVVGVGRVERSDLLVGVVHRQEDPVDLLLHVAAQVPGHRLEPGQRVDRRPLLRLVVEAAEAEQGVLERDLGGPAVLEVGVDAFAVGLQCRPRLRLEQRQLALGHAPPAHRAEVLVVGQRGPAEQLGQPPCGDVTAYVHLEEAVLRLHEPLGPHQVGGGVCVDLRDPVLVPDHLDLAVEHLQLQLTGGLRERPPDEHDRGHQQGDEGEDQENDEVRRGSRGPWPAAKGLPPRLHFRHGHIVPGRSGGRCAGRRGARGRVGFRRGRCRRTARRVGP